MGRTSRCRASSTPPHKRYGEAGEFRDLYAADPLVKEVVDTARGLEGLKRQVGSTPPASSCPVNRWPT